jgi:hypothetical protein
LCVFDSQTRIAAQSDQECFKAQFRGGEIVLWTNERRVAWSFPPLFFPGDSPPGNQKRFWRYPVKRAAIF